LILGFIEMIQAIANLLRSLPTRRKVQLSLLLGLMVMAAMAELVSLGAILPFLAMLADPIKVAGKISQSNYARWLDLSSPEALRLQMTVLFVVAVFMSGVVRIALAFATARINFGIGHDIGVEVVRRTLLQPYSVHIARNSSEILGGIAKVDQAVFTIYTILMTLSSLFISVCIIAALFWIDARIAVAVMIAFGVVYGVTSFLTRRMLSAGGQLINLSYAKRFQTIQEGLGGIRDIILDHTQHVFVQRFAAIDLGMRRAQGTNNIIGPSPRFVIETTGMVLIALLAYTLTRTQSGFAAAVPVLGAFALGAQRLIPLLQQGYQGWVTTLGSKHLLQDVVQLLEQPVPAATTAATQALAFRERIEFVDVSFRYKPATPVVLENIDLRIQKGTRIGLVGTTGSGKSTLLDLLMGLLTPTAGSICVDGVPLHEANVQAWRKQIAHVPQAIFLADASFAENIAFGVPKPEIDLPRVKDAALRAQIAGFIETNPLAYDAVVGERGVQLSGGQRQRIGIARALYKHASVLVFDEATSALDQETEQSVIEAIEGLGRDLTILMIAHRVSTLRSCDIIYRLENGRITGSGTHADIQMHQFATSAPSHHA
jgi:ABC-type multidrug transport system fused ATPase/permease subunit